ncbi:MAG: nucleotidyl transferase AbiEii/AbiGii toxin family protein [Elusimicrobiota bacterium]|nr:nucleotidyl transferase AbiEii/AbiGii toxin family protein [Elusimicrobiota bacterium]
MTNKEIKNIPASVKAKLLNLAKTEKKDFNKILLRYFQEGLLRRLSLSKYKNKFVLKGGLLLILIDVKTSRPTMDIDFLVQKTKNDLETVKNIFKEISALDLADGISFSPGSVEASRIKEDADYEGVRVKILCKLGQAAQIMQIDLGFGDVITPDKQNIFFPSMIWEEKSELKGYPLETVVAEKFEAMIKLALLNSCMKDFYDVYTIIRQGSLRRAILKAAIKNTFENRNTELPAEPFVFTEAFYNHPDKQTQWMAFLKKNAITDAPSAFKEVVAGIKEFFKN